MIQRATGSPDAANAYKEKVRAVITVIARVERLAWTIQAQPPTVGALGDAGAILSGRFREVKYSPRIPA